MTMNEEIKKDLLMHGYKIDESNIKLTPEILNLPSILVDIPKIEEITASKIDRTEVVPTAKKFFENKVRLHDICETTTQHVNDLVQVYVNPSILEEGRVDELLDVIDKRLQRINPFDLQIIYSGTTPIDTNLQETVYPFISNKSLQNNEPSFRYIELGKQVSKFTPVSLVHEIVNTQLASTKSSVVYYYNKEVLPIFFEKYAALEFSTDDALIHKYELLRFRQLLDCISKLSNPTNCNKQEILDSYMYINSILKALNLFDTFLFCKTLRADIMRSIQTIFDDKKTVENLLDEQRITLENSISEKLIKKHI